MAEQYLRACSIIAAGAGGAIQFAADQENGLRIKFEVRQMTIQTPNNAIVRIYNLKEETAQQFVTKKAEFTQLEIQAGYGSNMGRIFVGTIVQAFKGREDPQNTYLDIYASDGDKGYNWAKISKTLKAGSTHQDHYDTILEAFSKYGITKGYVPSGLDAIKYPRAVTMSGMARSYMRDLARATNSTWSIQDGKLDLVPLNQAKPGDIIVSNSRTGMIGLPVQTQGGILVRMLINPALRPRGKLKIDNASIQMAAWDLSIAGSANNNNELLRPSLSADGTYIIVSVDFTGDTRGNVWYADISCYGQGGTATASQIATYVGATGSGSDAEKSSPG